MIRNRFKNFFKLLRNRFLVVVNMNRYAVKRAMQKKLHIVHELITDQMKTALIKSPKHDKRWATVARRLF